MNTFKVLFIFKSLNTCNCKRFQDHHLMQYLLGFVCASPESGEDAVCPIVGGHVETTEHLGGRDGFRVHPHLLVGLATVCH